MKKRKFRVFLTCFLFFVICSSFVSAIAKPIEEKNNSIYTEEHEHNKDCIISTDSEEKNGTDDERSDDNSLNENSDIETEENKDSVITEENNVEEGLEEENKNESEEAPKDENKKEPEKEEREYKNPTPDTFESVIGEYSLTTILNKINIFSFQKITASHIVGPIIAKEAYREDNRTGRLMFADYTNGNPSYIEVIRRQYSETGSVEGQAEVGLNYGFEAQAPPNVDLSVKPNLYVGESKNEVRDINSTYWMLDGKVPDFAGPNNSGNSPILQNDNFMNYEKAEVGILNESNKLLNTSKNIVVNQDSKYKIDAKGVLTIDVGKSYLIKDASNLKRVNMIFPEGYHPIKNPYPYPTTINISDSKLLQVEMLGKNQNLLPEIYVDGERFVGSIHGSPGFGDGQIGEMNRVIWNMPNLETIGEEGRLVRTMDTDILGHIVAPKAEFWNYRISEQGKFEWNGGNMNGCAIVKSWHGGTMESHFWPYNGEIAPPKENKVAMSVNAKKVFNKGSLDNLKFNFTLEYDGESLPEGIIAENIPQTVQQKSDGTIEFLPITFIKEGIYNFKIKEIKGDNPDIIYDDSVYLLKVTVYEENGELKYKNEITKVSGTSHETANDIVFINEKKLKFTIEKKDKLTGNLLEGAIFDLYEADENGNPKGESIIKDIATDSTGKITVSNKILEYNKRYVLVETKAPENYMTGGNIIFYIKGELGPYPDGEGVVVIENGGVLEVLNTKSDEILPETGGIGTDKFIFVGLGLMLSSLILLKIKLFKG